MNRPETKTELTRQRLSETPSARSAIQVSKPHDPHEGVPVTTPSSGPRISFPAIEKKYGRPIEEWIEIIASSPLTKYSELVNWLKSEYGVGHGHAMALVHKHREDQG